MKKIFLPVLLLVTAVTLHAQRYDNIKTLVTLNQYEKAKEEFDKNITKEKFGSKAEAHILHSLIYSGIALKPANDGKPIVNEYIGIADKAFAKYLSMEPGMELVADGLYQQALINLYSGLYKLGYIDFQAAKYTEALPTFQKVADYSDLLIKSKILPGPIDTTVSLLTGYTAEKAKDDATATKYYLRLADNKVGGEGNESPYQYLIQKSFREGKLDDFKKFLALGKTLYPKAEYFTYDETDFALGLEQDFNKKLNYLNAIITKEPANFKANYVLGQILFDTLYNNDENAPKPADSVALEKKMLDAFAAAGNAHPDDPNPQIYIGNHYINQSVYIGNDRSVKMVEIRKKYKPNTPLSKEDQATKLEMDTKYNKMLNEAKPAFEKVVAIFSKMSTLTGTQKQQYRRIASYLSDIAADNHEFYKTTKPAESAKFKAEQDKWDELYTSIK